MNASRGMKHSSLLEMMESPGFQPVSTAPKDGRVIVGKFMDGAERLIRWVVKPDYQGWDTGNMIQPIKWRKVHRDEIIR
jgi:hypothetical protein